MHKNVVAKKDGKALAYKEATELQDRKYGNSCGCWSV